MQGYKTLKFYNICNICISILLIFVLIAGNCSKAFASDKKKICYMGDSFTYNFPLSKDIDGVIDRIYPEIVAEKFAYDLFTEKIESENKNYIYDTSPFVKGGCRATDALALITYGYGGDGYSADVYEMIEAVKYGRIPELMKDDIFILQFGYSNIACYLFDNIEYLLGAGSSYHNTDLSQLSLPDLEKEYMGFSDKLFAALKADMGDELPAAKEYIKRISASNSDDTIQKIIESCRYAFLSAIVHYDKLIERIRDLNPDAQIYVMGLSNTAKDVEFSFSLLGNRHSVPIGKLFGSFLDAINLYMKRYSPNRFEYSYVKPVENLKKIGDLFSDTGNEKSEEITEKFIYRFFFDSYSSLSSEKQAEYSRDELLKMCKRCLPGVKRIASSENYNLLKAFVSPDILKLDELLNEYSDSPLELLDRAFSTDCFGILTASELEKSFGRLYLMTSMRSAYLHPSQEGHKQMAERLIKAMQKNRIKNAVFKSVF